MEVSAKLVLKFQAVQCIRIGFYPQIFAAVSSSSRVVVLKLLSSKQVVVRSQSLLLVTEVGLSMRML